MKQPEESPTIQIKGGRSIGRWFMVSAVLIVSIVYLAISLRNLSDAARLASCRPHSIRWVTDGYSLDHEGMYPPLSPTPGRLMFVEGAEQPYAGAGVRADFICEFDLQDGREVTRVPGAPIDDWSYIYLGYLIENQAQLELFAEAYKRIIAAGGDFTQDIKVAAGQGNCGTDTIYRLRDLKVLVELLPCLKDRLDEIPMVIEWPENHRGPVAKVMVLDPKAYEKKLAYPGEWPMTEAAIGVLRELDAMGSGGSAPSIVP